MRNADSKVMKLSIAVLAAPVLAWASNASAVVLTGSVSVPSATPAANLTTEGEIDWALWNITSAGTATSLAPTNTKAGGPGLFSSITVVSDDSPAKTLVRGGIASNKTFSYSDGTSPTSQSDITSGLVFPSSLDNIGEGVQFTITGNPGVEQVVKIWASGTNGSGRFTASVNGASDLVLDGPTYGGKTPTLFTLNFRPDNVGDLLTVKYALLNDGSSGNSHVGFQAVAVSVPEPATGAALFLGAGGLLGFRRRRSH